MPSACTSFCTEIPNGYKFIKQTVFSLLDLGTFDGTHLAWVAPRVLTPLVLHIEKFQDKGIAMGVEGKLLDLATIRRRNYELKVNETFIEISVPYGAEGGYLKVTGV